MRAHFLCTPLAAILLGCCAGCLPNATWLPDSSGFVYTGGKDKLYVYDLAKKEPRVLVEKGAGPAWPAVSSDGKRIAVALRKDDGEDVTLEVIVFDRDGKELHRSPKLNWAKHKKEGFNDKTAPQAFWVPGQDKLLLSSDGVSGTYDLKTKSSVNLDMNVATFGSSPIRPDGKGFLAYKMYDGEYFLIDWDGIEKTIELKPKEAFDLRRSDDSSGAGMRFSPLMHSSHWDGSTAVVSWDAVRVKVDSDKLIATVEHIKPALSADGKVIQHQVELAGGGVVRAVELSKRYQEKPAAEKPSFGRYRIEVVKQGAKEAKTLMDDAGFFMIYPSPDGKRAVVKCSKSLEAIFTESKPDRDVLFLIDGLGNVADKIDLVK